MLWSPAGTAALFNSKPSKFLALNEFRVLWSPAKIQPSMATLHHDYKKFEYRPFLHSEQSCQKTQNKSCIIAGEKNHGVKRTASIINKKTAEKINLDPVMILTKDGDWTKENFWNFVKFLRQSSRTSEVLRVFDCWKNKNKSRINEENYAKILGLLCEDGLTKEAILVFEEMKSRELSPSLDIYNCMIHSFAQTGDFHDALIYLKEMKDTGVKPNTETYDGLIQAYGKYGMYDEMSRCLKEMKSSECLPDHITYNILIREFAKAGLLKKMDHTYQILLSNKMDLQSLTLISMLDAYANFRILDKMEKVLKRVINSKALLREDLIRKIAGIYIENLMFSRLDEFGLYLSSGTGSTDLVWCLRILSHACSLSRRGMYTIIEEMESDRVPWNVTIANIISLAYLKMKDFRHLQILLTELPFRYVKPDIVTFGILFDAFMSGFDGTVVEHTWSRAGFFEEKVEMKTDPLVLIAFGKGQFLSDLEDMYLLMEPGAKEERIWSYCHLIDLILRYRNAQLVGLTQNDTKDVKM